MIESKLVGKLGMGVALAVGAALVLGAGCKKEEPIQYPQPGPDAAPPPPPPPPPPADDAGAGPIDAGPAPLSAEAEQMLADAITHLATKHARGMKKEGDPIYGAIAEGGTVEGQIMIQPGKCYAVVGMGGPVVTELDLELHAQSPLPVPMPGGAGLKFAVDNTNGPEAAISPCWKNVLGIAFPAKVIVRARTGTGPVGAQVYVK